MTPVTLYNQKGVEIRFHDPNNRTITVQPWGSYIAEEAFAELLVARGLPLDYVEVPVTERAKSMAEQKASEDTNAERLALKQEVTGLTLEVQNLKDQLGQLARSRATAEQKAKETDAMLTATKHELEATSLKLNQSVEAHALAANALSAAQKEAADATRENEALKTLSKKKANAS